MILLFSGLSSDVLKIGDINMREGGVQPLEIRQQDFVFMDPPDEEIVTTFRQILQREAEARTKAAKECREEWGTADVVRQEARSSALQPLLADTDRHL